MAWFRSIRYADVPSYVSYVKNILLALFIVTITTAAALIHMKIVSIRMNCYFWASLLSAYIFVFNIKSMTHAQKRTQCARTHTMRFHSNLSFIDLWLLSQFLNVFHSFCCTWGGNLPFKIKLIIHYTIYIGTHMGNPIYCKLLPNFSNFYSATNMKRKKQTNADIQNQRLNKKSVTFTFHSFYTHTHIH